jgi:hypothetical protein
LQGRVVGQGDKPWDFFSDTCNAAHPKLRKKCGHWYNQNNYPPNFQRYGQAPGYAGFAGPLGVIQETHLSQAAARETMMEEDNNSSFGGNHDDDDTDHDSVSNHGDNTSIFSPPKKRRMVSAMKDLLRKKKKPYSILKPKIDEVMNRVKTAEDCVEMQLAIEEVEIRIIQREAARAPGPQQSNNPNSDASRVYSFPASETRRSVARHRPPTSPPASQR